jgi:hypothetical protein
MKSFATEIASAMSNRMESEEHKSVFGTPAFGKFAAKKKDDEEDKKKNPFAKKDDKDSDKDSDKKKDKKDDKKDEKDGKKKKAEVLNAIFDGLSALSSSLDDIGLTKSSIYTMRVIDKIVAEATDGAYDCGDIMSDDDGLKPENQDDIAHQLAQLSKTQIEPEGEVEELSKEESALLKELGIE